MRIYLLSIFFCGFIFSAYPQNSWNWPDKSTNLEFHELAKEKWVYSNDRISGTIGKLDDARSAIQWLLKNTPKLNDALYINAISLYENLEASSSGSRKKTYQDTVLTIYDLRIQHFGNTAVNLNRKGLKAWYYLRNDSEETEKLLQLYKEIITLNKNRTYSLNLYAYFDLVCQLRGRNALSNEEGLRVYNDIKDILTFNIDKGEDVKTWNTINDKIETKMLNCLSLSCDLVKESYGKAFKNNPTIENARLTFGLLLKAECIKDPLFVKVAEYLYEQDSSSELASTIAKSCHLKGDFACALNFYEKSALLTSSKFDKGSDYYQMAHIYKRQENKNKAKEYALKAVKADPTKKVAYELIGDLYFHSFEDCATDNDLQSKAIFLAAYEMYKKAGATDKMKKVQQGFPTISTIFEYGKKEGDAINTGCWVNETVVIQKRP